MTGLEPEVLKLLSEGRKIDAIKKLREIRKIGLKESKDIVDAYALKYGLTNQSVHNVSGGNCLLVLIVIALAGYIIYKYLI